MTDNDALLQQLHQSTDKQQQPKLRKIYQLLFWLFCFLYVVAALSDIPATRDMLAYAQRISAEKWGKWVECMFRQQKETDSSIPWNVIDQSLIAAMIIVGHASTGQVCSICAGSGHTTDSCALRTLHLSALPAEGTAPPSQVPPQQIPPTPLPQAIDSQRILATVCMHKCMSCQVYGYANYQCTISKKAKSDLGRPTLHQLTFISLFTHSPWLSQHSHLSIQ